MAFGKAESERLVEAYIYLAKIQAPQDAVQSLIDWVSKNGPFSADTISRAISLDLNFLNRQGTTKNARDAIRALLLARLAVETPKPNALNSTTDFWKSTYKSYSQSALDKQIFFYLEKLPSPINVIPLMQMNASPKSYGLKLTDVVNATGNLKPSSAKVAGVRPPPMPGVTASRQNKKDFFETTSRVHVILSGHGSWPQDSVSGQWPYVQLGAQQAICYYCDHYHTLGNAAGQLVDNRRFPAAREERTAKEKIPDYTLHPKDKLVLLNKGGGNADQNFITPKVDTKLSSLIKDPKYYSATFHWAACRVVFDATGKIYCPNHGWEDFASSCIVK